MARIFFINAYVLVQGKITDNLLLTDNVLHVIAFPKESGVFAMISIVFVLQSNRLIAQDDVKIKKLMSGDYVVEISFVKPMVELPITLFQRYFGDITVTYFLANKYSLLIERGDKYRILEVEGLIEEGLQVDYRENYLLISGVRKNCEEVRGEERTMEYSALIDTENMRVIFSCFGSASFSDGGVILTEKIKDMKAHVKKYEYLLINGIMEPNSFSVICGNEHIYVSELTAYLFLEALIIESYDEANSYLCEELKTDEEGFREFFKDLVGIEELKTNNTKELIALFGDENYAECKRCRFIVNNDKITDVTIDE